MTSLLRIALASALLLGSAGAVFAQPAVSDLRAAAAAPENDKRPEQASDTKRLCAACPPHRPGRALWQTTAINVFYELANLARGQVTAHITPASWWDNMENGWVWDLDDFTVNQIGHPYQGNNYYNAARSNGLSFYESAAVTAFGSATWEYFGETNKPSLNDFINTTLGGIALGEMFHRAAWLVRDPHKTGKGRLWNEIGAMALDPVTGYNRFVTGDASRVGEKPEDMVPSSLGTVMSAGVLWRGSQTRVIDAAGQAFLETDLLYGNVEGGSSKTPYDAFSVRFRFGGGSAFSEARVRGRLLGHPLKDGKLQFNVLQTYDYQSNDAYATGSQSFETSLGTTMEVSDRTKLLLMGWGGLTVLGAIDSLPLGLTEKPDEEDGHSDAGQGVSEGPRFYDYGPGSNFGGIAYLTRNRRTLGTMMYEGRQLYSLDGVRANHFLQRLRLDVLVPVRGRFGVGTSVEYFFRKSYYQDPEHTRQTYKYPQVRAYLTWSQQ